MVEQFYIPDRGDIIWLSLNPQAGTEMAKRRPCLVLSPKALNNAINKCLIIPITNTPPRIATHLPLPQTVRGISGTLVVEQVRSLDFRARNASKITELNDHKLYSQVVDIVYAIMAG